MRLPIGVPAMVRCALRCAPAAAALLLACGIARAETPAGYNVLLISLDTLRADHLSCYGYPRATSPHLDQLAKEGALFEHAVAASSWTIPSHMSLFTSLYPSAHGVENPERTLGKAVPTLAQVLAEHGYATAAFVTGPNLNHRYGFSRGFQLYDDFTAMVMCDTNLFADHPDHSIGANIVPKNSVITNLGALWLKRHGKEKFFLFLHYLDCHADYIPPPPYDRMFDPAYTGRENGRNIYERERQIEAGIAPEDFAHIVALYDGAIAHTDEHVGRILQLLGELRLAEKTLVIIVSDHGEGFLEHGLITHGNSLYEELVHVPFILRLPGVIPAGLRIKENASHVDVMPTVLGFLGIKSPGGLQGMDLSGACRGRGGAPDRFLYSETAAPVLPDLRAVRWGNYKLIEERDCRPLPLEIVRDGRELDAQKAGLDDPERHKLEDRLTEALAAGPSAPKGSDRAAQPSKVDETTLRRLKSLGYVQ